MLHRAGRLVIFVLLLPAVFACHQQPPRPAEAVSFNQQQHDFSFAKDELRLADLIDQWAADVGAEPPHLDGSLILACRSLAYRVKKSGPDTVDRMTNPQIQAELIRFGVSDSAIRTQLVATPRLSELDATIGKSLRQELADGRYTHYGVSAVRSLMPPVIYVALVLSRRPVSLDPFPKWAAIGDRIELTGALTSGLNKPKIYLSPPSGKVYELLYNVGAGDAFRSTVFFNHGAGVYRIEVSADGEHGPEIVALMPVEVGEVEPTPVVADLPAARDEDEARKLVYATINRERKRAGLPALEWHATLAKVAQQHAEDMRRMRYAAHRSPTTGMVSDRATAAGLNWRRIAENVALNQTALSAHAGLMESPAHRVNVVDENVDLIGIGVAFADDGHGHRLVYLVENFMSLQ